jgi:GNAT superfamily N-acetyltransferase
METSLRQALLSDGDEIARLSAQLDYPTSRDQVVANLNELLADPNHGVLVVEGRRLELRGWIHVFKSHRIFAAPFAELGGVVVDKAERRRGVGANLMAAAEAWAVQEGCTTVRIRSNSKRQDAHAFYGALGYRPSKSQLVFEKAL